MMQEISHNMLEVFGMEAKAVMIQMDETFPNVTPSPDDTIEKIMYRSGQRSVVEWLQNKLDEK